MEIVLVILAVSVAWLLWRILNVQAVRTQIEATKVAAEHAAREIDRAIRVLGSPEDAKKQHRLIEYYEQLAPSMGLDADGVKNQLMHSSNKEVLKDLVEESVDRGVPCRFLDEYDYDRFVPQAYFPGPMPTESMMLVCAADCDETLDLTYMPPDAVACPFCGSPTKHILWDADKHEEHMAEWRKADRPWQLWKKRSPKAASSEEAKERARLDEDTAVERAEFEQALAAFRAKGGQAKKPPPLPSKLRAAAPPSSPVVTTSPVSTATQSCPACPKCRAPTVMVAEFDRWLCGRCNIYV